MLRKLIFKLLNAKIIRKGDQFQSMSPWAVIQFDGQRKTTEEVKNGNLEPEFNIEYEFQRNSDYKIIIQIFKKEYYYGPLKNLLERDILIGQGIYNAMQNAKQKGRQQIEIDLLFDYDNKLAGKVYAEIQFEKTSNSQKLQRELEENQKRKNHKGHIQISKIQIISEKIHDLSYYVKIRSGDTFQKSDFQKGKQGQIQFQNSYNIYISNQKLIYFDIQEVLYDEDKQEVLVDEFLGLAILQIEKATKEEQNPLKQEIIIKIQGKIIGKLIFETQYIQYQQNNKANNNIQILLKNKLTKEDLQKQLEQMQKQSKYWISPERQELQELLKKKQLLEKRKMNMRSFTHLEKANQSSSIFSKINQQLLLEKKDIVLDTIPVKLPYVTTNNHLLVPVLYSKEYFRNVHGTGFSTIESSTSLKMSVPKYSIPEQQRFKENIEQSPGPGDYGGNGIAEDKFLDAKFKIKTALSDVRQTKIERKPREAVDTGLKKKK
ncbi:hypothetical protein IMG5_123030 [Ichthyophthirius multifiliis]|uniref:C2 domain-containing protein n=1 Tax=Ichthyophthirius multifiliis TaxID=5932 RepID=G0QVE2_ICHMU|nr:hypothetical protein IMG5_123030 [Ichthyophthirius multifiliis]EGR30831.1 hypothetical protein IMG5_123030 [Ichthyophthirius multifiliis]|eukprot:XP_004032418.1 hypothetical protein IMG5_123030 [Ichthyophthirius multifiliis]